MSLVQMSLSAALMIVAVSYTHLDVYKRQAGNMNGRADIGRSVR